MKKRLKWIAMISLAVAISVCGTGPIFAKASPDATTILNVDGDKVKIFRDDFGVPHIFAKTDRGLFVGFGYAVAEDRLWQLEANRRAARGQLAEILGPGFLDADIAARTVGYTDDELDDMFASLPPEVQERFQAYVDGIYRYINEVVLPDPDQQNAGGVRRPWHLADTLVSNRCRRLWCFSGTQLR